MKKNFILLALLTCAINLFAQEKSESISFNDPIPTRPYNISVGPKIGVNMSSMSGNPEGIDMGAKSGTGFNGGLAANIHFGRRTEASKGGTGLFGAQIEAMYSQNKIKTSSDDLTLNYLEVPVLLQYYIMPNLNIEVGPTFASVIGRSPDRLDFDKAIIYTKELKGFDVKLSAGIGYRFKCGLTTNARYNLGTSDLAGNLPCKVSTFQVSLGWMFKIVK